MYGSVTIRTSERALVIGLYGKAVTVGCVTVYTVARSAEDSKGALVSVPRGVRKHGLPSERHLSYAGAVQAAVQRSIPGVSQKPVAE